MNFIINNKKLIKTIFVLSLPVIIETILQTFLGTVDTYFAGRIGDSAIAGISVTNLIINLFIAFFIAVSIGSSAIVSRNFGRGDSEKVESTIKQSIILGCILGASLGLISFIFSNGILRLSGATGYIINTAMPYYLVVVCPLVFLCLSLILSSCIRAIGNTKIPMMATIIANILNIILNICFINLGMGIMGLGLATTISRVINVLILLFELKKSVNFKFNNFNIDKSILKEIINIGTPAGAEKLIMRIGQLVYGNLIISLGINSYVAHNIAGNIESYSYIPSIGFGVATSVLVGIGLGEDNIKKVKDTVLLSNIITMILMSLIGVIFFVFPRELVSLFTDTKEVQDLVVKLLRLIALFQPLSAMTQVFTNTLQGAGDTKFPMFATLIGIWGGRVFLGYIFGVILGFGLLGVWIGYALDISVRGVILLIRFKNGKWQKIVI